MKHMDDNDISRMMDGVLSRSEREAFQRHLAHCDDCLAVYSEALKFRDAGKQNLITLRKPRSINLRRIAAAAVLVIAVILGAIFLLQGPEKDIKNEKLNFIARQMGKVSRPDGRSFATSIDRDYAAILSGILLENLKFLVNQKGPEELKQEVQSKLAGYVSLFQGENKSVIDRMKHPEPGSVKTIDQFLRRMMENQSLSGLFEFGIFLGRALVQTLDGVLPAREDIDRFLDLVRQKKLPQGVLRRLQDLKNETDAAAAHGILLEIQYIIFN